MCKINLDYESDKEEAEMLVESIFSKNSAAEKFEIKPQKTSPEQIDKIPSVKEDVDEEKNDE